MKDNNLVARLEQLAATFRLPPEKKREILDGFVLGMNWMETKSPSWFLTFKHSPVEMDEVDTNPLAQLYDRQLSVVVDNAKEYSDWLERRLAVLKGASNEEVVLTNLLWTATVKILKEQIIDVVSVDVEAPRMIDVAATAVAA